MLTHAKISLAQPLDSTRTCESKASGFAGWGLTGWASRASLCLVFVWFGALKMLDLSPATQLVGELLSRTLSFIPQDQFLVAFGGFEVAIGLLFMVPGRERLAVGLLAVHMLTTVAPLALLPQITWQAPFVPTLVGQYIIKNATIIALAMTLVVRRPCESACRAEN